MKQVITVVDKTVKKKDGSYKEIKLEKKVADKNHLAAQINYPSQVFKDKKKYNRKEKHRGRAMAEKV